MKKYYHGGFFFILIFIGDQAIKKNTNTNNTKGLHMAWLRLECVGLHNACTQITGECSEIHRISLTDQAYKSASIRHKRWSLRVVFLTKKNPTKVFDFTKSCKMS